MSQARVRYGLRARTYTFPTRRNPGYRFGQETDARPTEFALGMDRGSDYTCGNVRRGPSPCLLYRLPIFLVARLTRYPDWGENQWDSTALPISVGNRANSLGGFGHA